MRIGESGVANTSAAFAYYALFAIFPLVALLLSVGSLFFAPQQVIETLRIFVPIGGEEERIVWQGVEALQSLHGGVNAAFLLVFLWAGLRFFQALVYGVSRAWHTENLPWWHFPIKNLILVFAVLFGVLFGVLAPLLLQIFRKIAQDLQSFLHVGLPDLDLERYVPVADLARWSLSLVFLFYSLSVLYWLAPMKRPRFRGIWGFALAVSVLLQAGQTLFVNYAPRFVHYNAIYGTVGSVMVLLLWIYVAGSLILTGACACAVWKEERASGVKPARS